MKNPTTKRWKFLVASAFALVPFCFQHCSSSKSSDETSIPVQAVSNVDFQVTEDKSSLAALYQLDHIKEWYPERILPPPFDYKVSLDGKSIVELSLLRNEIFARNGYLFDDAILRGHFNQFPWYQPIFDVEGFKVQLNKEEQDFVNKVLNRENELLEKRYTKFGGYDMVGMDHVYNLMQFKSIDPRLTAALSRNNFAIVPAGREQLFYLYDENHYQYIPNFITTDLYLQVMHKHFSNILQKVEEEQFIPLLTTLLRDLYNQSIYFAASATDDQKAAARWVNTYFGIAHSLISGNMQAPDDPIVGEELAKIVDASGSGSEFLGAPFLQYAQFTPRGNYATSAALVQYFRCVKWLSTAPMYVADDERFTSAIIIASLIKREPESLKAFQRYNDAVKFIVGEEDNLSVSNLIGVLTDDEAKNPAQLHDAARLAALRKKLFALESDRIRPKGGDEETSDKLANKSILFTAGRYTFDAEILSRLTHVLRPDPKRPFPKGLDVFASLGSVQAKNILLNEYRDQQKWPAFTDSLNALTKKFSAYNDWDKNIYTKTFAALASLNTVEADGPLFTKTPAWAKKTLSTSLAAWTELKHDMLLYAEQPYAAQAGEGGGPPPPMHYSYVEPNIAFWEKSLALLDFQEQRLTSMGMLNERTLRIITELKEIGNLLLKVTNKQLASEKITPEEFHALSYLGGQIEYLTFSIFDSDHLPEKEKLVAVVADVYNYNGQFLEEGVGLVDEIYVVAEINGKPYLTKGAVFSYYEFTSNTPLTDEAWRAYLENGTGPARPGWLSEIIVNVPPLESKKNYSF